MANATARTGASREDIRRAFYEFTQALTGKAPDPGGVARGIQLSMGNALISKISQNFSVLSGGGTSEAGYKWQPLTRETIAQRRVTPTERKSLGITGKRTRGFLTAAQDKRWKAIFGSRLAKMLSQGMDIADAKAKAGQIAWAILKSEGALTKLDVLGGRKVDSLRDTGLLKRSFNAGVGDRPSGAAGQIFEVPPGVVIVGTRMKPWHHKGIPGKLPARPFWPQELPETWWAAINGAMIRGMFNAAKQIVQSIR
jgi:hypothetical protein